MKNPAWVLGLILPLALHGAAQVPSTPPARPAPVPLPLPKVPDDLAVTYDVVFGQAGSKVLTAEILRPKDPQKAPTRAVIYVHGGGWAGGDEKHEVARVFFLAQAGYLIVSINYRLSGEAKWPAQVKDCKLGIRWLRAHAAEYHIDPDHIGIAGQSAGGNLVACLGTMDDPKLDDEGGYSGVSSKVQAVVDTSGPVDFTHGNFYDGSTFIPELQKPKDTAMLTALFGTTFAANPQLYIDSSPITHVRADDPPFLVACGEKDAIVSPEQGKTFAAALAKAGVPVELIVVKNANHGLGPIPGGLPTDPDTKTLRERIRAFFDKYLK